MTIELSEDCPGSNVEILFCMKSFFILGSVPRSLLWRFIVVVKL